MSTPALQSEPATLQVYPNPSTGTFMVNMHTAAPQEVGYIVYEETGRIVYKTERTTNTTISIELNEPPGVYMLAAYGKGIQQQATLIITAK